jgi:hypothetical protein
MKEFIFSVLSCLGGIVHNGLVRFLPLFFGENSIAVHFQRENLQRKKPQQKKEVSVLAKNSRKYSSSAPNHNLCSKNQLNVVKIAFFLREPIHATAKVLIKNRAFLDNIERLRNSVQDTIGAATFAQRIQIPQHCQIRELLNCDQRSRIVASFHFGNFVYEGH